jgi:hypothetical protein
MTRRQNTDRRRGTCAMISATEFKRLCGIPMDQLTEQESVALDDYIAADVLAELETLHAQCHTEGHMPDWVRCDYWSADAEYQCTRCGNALEEPKT